MERRPPTSVRRVREQCVRELAAGVRLSVEQVCVACLEGSLVFVDTGLRLAGRAWSLAFRRKSHLI